MSSWLRIFEVSCGSNKDFEALLDTALLAAEDDFLYDLGYSYKSTPNGSVPNCLCLTCLEKPPFEAAEEEIRALRGGICVIIHFDPGTRVVRLEATVGCQPRSSFSGRYASSVGQDLYDRIVEADRKNRT